jgi:hypothetical protein
MNQLLVFNHHSLPFDSKDSAFSTIPEFLKICIKASNLGLSTVLVDDSIDKNWFRLQLADDYYWQDWYHQNNNDQHKDLIRAFRSIQTRQPFFSADDIGEGLDLFEVKLNDSESYSAIQAAVWHDSPLTSFPTRKPWNTSPIQVDISEIQQGAELHSTKSEIINFHSISVIENFAPELLKNRNASIKSAGEILEKQNDIYPFIEFCGDSIQQLKNWTHSSTLLEQVKESILALNRFSEKWHNKEFENYSHDNLKSCGLNHKVSGESQHVLQNQTLRKEREFWLPNGSKEIFENHIKIARGYRLHFFADSKSKKIFIGYIGNHLRLK